MNEGTAVLAADASDPERIDAAEPIVELQGFAIGDHRFLINYIDAVELEMDTNFMSGVTNRYRFRLRIAPERRAESKLYKKIALHLVFRSRQLQQLEYKCVVMLTQMFQALAERYIHRTAPMRLRLLAESDESAIDAAADEAGRARIICDAISRLTDGSATRFWQRLFDADYRSIVDLG